MSDYNLEQPHALPHVPTETVYLCPSEPAKPCSRAATGSVTDGNGEYRASWLWPHATGSVEEAGYEFANAKTMEYQEQWWRILLERAKSLNDQAQRSERKGQND